MSKSEYEVFKKLIEEKRKQIKNNQTEARSVLDRAGIFTKNGTLKKVYKDICTQQSPV